MYFASAWMLGSVSLILPTFRDAPVAGMICMMPMAPTGLRLF
jgi:hypothetical protein